eukprot:1176991-Prorocentrum_minimum.AAC.3
MGCRGGRTATARIPEPSTLLQKVDTCSFESSASAAPPCTATPEPFRVSEALDLQSGKRMGHRLSMQSCSGGSTFARAAPSNSASVWSALLAEAQGYRRNIVRISLLRKSNRALGFRALDH